MFESILDLFYAVCISILAGLIVAEITKLKKKYEPIRNTIMSLWFDFWLPPQWSPHQRYKRFQKEAEMISQRNQGHTLEEEVFDLDLEKNPALKEKKKRKNN